VKTHQKEKRLEGNVVIGVRKAERKCLELRRKFAMQGKELMAGSNPHIAGWF
jgi:hypothetical protein